MRPSARTEITCSPAAIGPSVQTVAKAKQLGAKIHVAYMEIGAMGAIGIFSDPTGAAIGVWAKAKKPAKKAKKRK